MKKLLAVFNVTNRILINKFKMSADTAVKKLMYAGAAAVILIIGILTSYLTTSSTFDLFIYGEESGIYMLLISALTFTTACTMIVHVLFVLLGPKESKLNVILRFMPMSAAKRHLARTLPVTADIVVISVFFMYILFLPPLFVGAISIGRIIAIACCIFLQSALVACLLNAAIDILIFLFIKIKIPYAKNVAETVTYIALIAYLLHFIVVYSDQLVNWTSFSYALPNESAALYLVFYNAALGVSIKYYKVIAVFLVTAAIFAVSAFLDADIKEKQSIGFLKRLPFPKRKFLTLALKDIKILISNENTVLAFWIIVLAVIILRVKSGYTIAADNVCVCIGAAASFTALSSFGTDSDKIPLYRQMGINKWFFTAAKLAGELCVSLLFYIFISLIMFSRGATFLKLASGAACMVTAVLFLFLIGVLLPAGSDDMHAKSLAMMILVVVGICCLYGYTQISGFIEKYIVLLDIIADIVLAVCIFKAAGRKWQNIK